MSKKLEEVKRRALAIGGKRFQFDWVLESGLTELLGRDDWQVFDGVRARRMKSSEGFRMKQSGCHNNSAVVAIQRGWECWSGLALSDDGIWRVHSWVRVPSTGTVYETTEPRTHYYGVKVDPLSCLG